MVYPARQRISFEETGSAWKRHEYRDVAQLISVGVELPLSEVHRDLAGDES